MKMFLGSVILLIGGFSALPAHAASNSANTANDTCPAGEYYVGYGECCPDGMVYDGNLQCSDGSGAPLPYNPGVGTDCPAGLYYVGDGQCCPDGEAYNGNGTCG